MWSHQYDNLSIVREYHRNRLREAEQYRLGSHAAKTHRTHRHVINLILAFIGRWMVRIGTRLQYRDELHPLSVSPKLEHHPSNGGV
ncbi:MAG: hypothetical protein CUN54_08110 [Phototrophicales bacterium]|nr:MAG: hypothetical protein CUN54_08110 [Phototrophicales bacterium]